MAAEFWSVTATVAFWCWVGSVILLIFRAFPTAGIFRIREALVFGSLSLLLAALWLVGLLHA